MAHICQNPFVSMTLKKANLLHLESEKLNERRHGKQALH